MYAMIYLQATVIVCNTFTTFQINEENKISNQTKFNISTSKTDVKILSKKLHNDFNWSFQCNKKL